MTSKFADVTTIGGTGDSDDGYRELLRDLDQMGKWPRNSKWSLIHTSARCCILRSPTRGGLSENGGALGNVVEHRDQRVQVHCSLREMSQVDRVVMKAAGTLALES